MYISFAGNYHAKMSTFESSPSIEYYLLHTHWPPTKKRYYTSIEFLEKFIAYQKSEYKLFQLVRECFELAGRIKRIAHAESHSFLFPVYHPIGPAGVIEPEKLEINYHMIVFYGDMDSRIIIRKRQSPISFYNDDAAIEIEIETQHYLPARIDANLIALKKQFMRTMMNLALPHAPPGTGT